MSHPDPVPGRIAALLRSVRFELAPYWLNGQAAAKAGRLEIRRNRACVGYLTVNPKHPSDGVSVTIHGLEVLDERHFHRFLRIAARLVDMTVREFSDVDYDSSEEPDDGE